MSLKKLLDKLIENNCHDFNLWIDTINKYLNSMYSDMDLASDEFWKVMVNCVNSFSKIAEICFAYGKFKDKWEYSHFHQNLYGPELLIKSLKTQCDYKLGLDDKGIYLSTDLRHNENLRYMSDDFWKLLLTLSDFEGFLYEEYEFVRDERRKEFPELFNTNKSMIFRIIRKYIFDSTETNNRYLSYSVGEFKIFWSVDNDFEQIVRKCCLAFKIMYKLNYDLWKISDLKTKKTFANTQYSKKR
ncbi:MAG: hypothetical protein H8D45_31575 [Bacteroidetes bacterium]|nr:hypothetical protein [Bacteroidota bacterium]